MTTEKQAKGNPSHCLSNIMAFFAPHLYVVLRPGGGGIQFVAAKPHLWLVTPDAMKLRCQDLAEAGVVLIPRDSEAFAPLFADIRRHLESPPPGSPPALPGGSDPLPEGNDPASAILWSQSNKPICAGSLIWRSEGVDARTRDRSSTFGVGAMPTLLLPFGLPEERRQFELYWHTILPNSKRYVSGDCQFGTNADVRAPEPAEIWKGGIMRWGAAREAQPSEMTSVTLILDSVFFSNGECAGPNESLLWEQILCAAGVYREVAWAVRRRFAAGDEPARILLDIEPITGPADGPPPPPPPPGGKADAGLFRMRARRLAAWSIAASRRRLGDEGTMKMLLGWADTELPQYRRI